jgi:hypothetical protein
MAFAYWIGHFPRNSGRSTMAVTPRSLLLRLSLHPVRRTRALSLDAARRDGRGNRTTNSRGLRADAGYLSRSRFGIRTDSGRNRPTLDFGRISCYMTPHRSGCIRIRARCSTYGLPHKTDLPTASFGADAGSVQHSRPTPWKGFIDGNESLELRRWRLCRLPQARRRRVIELQSTDIAGMQ